MSTAAAKPAQYIPNRAPKGGAVSSVNGLFYRGGRFMPAVPDHASTRPAKLEGSSRQVDWARRIRAARLQAIDAQRADLILGMDTIRPAYRALVRPAIEALAFERHRLMVTTSAAAIIDAR